MKIAENDDFESGYVNKFRALASPYGIFIDYEKDRAALDIGIHFTQACDAGSKIVTPAIAWFQLKGITSKKLGADAARNSKSIAVTLETRHLRFWEFLPFPVYVAVFVESLDVFYVINIKRWIAEELGGTLGDKSQTKTLNIPTKNVLDDAAFRAIRTAGQKPLIQEALKGDGHAANIFCRDDQLVKWIATAEERAVEIRVRVIKYESKLRTEVYFEERNTSPEITEPWVILRRHWHFMMRFVDDAFPYLALDPREPSELYAVRDDEGCVTKEERDFWPEYDVAPTIDELTEFGDGRIFTGKGQFEMMEYTFTPALNEVGEQWFKALTTLEEAELISIEPEPLFVSVAPFSKDI